MTDERLDNRTSELEEQVARLCESNAALVRVEISQQKAIEAAEAKLRAVREMLPGKVERLRCLACDIENESYKPEALAKRLYTLADELEAPLNKAPKP